MSDFLLIVPAGWSEFADINALVNDGAVPADLVYSWIANEAWSELDTMFINAARDTQGQLVANARLFQTDTGYRLWVKLV